MSNYTLMNKALSRLLNEGETIIHPICAVLERNGRRYFSYFAFTDDALLIALTYENNTTWSKRISLDIASLKIKEYKFFGKRGYEVNIAFKNNTPIKIIIPYKNFTYGEQKEDIQQFINYIKEHSPQNSYPPLKNITGTKLRRQYFNAPLWFVLPIIPICIILIAMVLIRHNEFSFSEWLALSLNGIGLLIAIISPFIVLSVLNRFWFGKIVSVINNQGIYFENNFLPWNKINKIEYIPDTAGRQYKINLRLYGYTRLKLTLNSGIGDEYDAEIKNFPLYGLFFFKKFCPDKKIKFDAKNVIWALVFLGIAIIVSLLIPFV